MVQNSKAPEFSGALLFMSASLPYRFYKFYSTNLAVHIKFN